MDSIEEGQSTIPNFLELAHLFAPFLRLRDIKSLLTVSHASLQTFRDDTVLEAWIIHAYCATCLTAPGPRTGLIQRLFSNELGSESLHIVHMGGDAKYWGWSNSNGLSKYPRFAQLRSVCWLEVNGSFENVLPGRYKVVWRVEMPSQSSAKFECDWSAKVFDSTGQQCGVSSSFKHGESPSWAAQLIGKGWFRIVVGEIEIPATCLLNTVRVQMFGGNKWWFEGLRIDYVALLPAPIGATPRLVSTPFAEVRLDRSPTERILCENVQSSPQ